MIRNSSRCRTADFSASRNAFFRIGAKEGHTPFLRTMTILNPTSDSAQRIGIAFILVGMFAITINDLLIKTLSPDYSLYQIVFVRSVLGLTISLFILQFEGGFAALRTRRPGLHLVRALMIVVANLGFFAALAVLPLAMVNALFFVAPLLITLLSIPLLGERVGPWRLGAVIVGFMGVLLVIGVNGFAGEWPVFALFLPVIAAFAYALMQILTRKLGGQSTAAAMAIYIQSAFLVVSGLAGLAFGDGKFVDAVDSESLRFVFRPWVWPAPEDVWVFAVIGTLVGVIAYSMSQAYRMGDAATIAPFEYVALPISVLWGFLFLSEVPGWSTWAGIVLIAGSGLFVYLRERVRGNPPSRPGARRA